MLKFLAKYATAIGFGLFIAIFAAADFFVPTREYSDLENRKLQQKPTLSWSAIMRQGDQAYNKKYEAYLNDQFVLRDEWISLKSRCESILGKIENNGIVYGKDGYLFEKYQETDLENLDKNVTYLTEFLEMYPELPVTFSLWPSSYQVLQDKLPAGLNNLDQQEMSQEIYATLAGSPSLQILDVTAVLKQHAQEYIFYRTDHHWTSYGAYLAYRELIEALGKTPVELASIEANQVEGFYGTYYSKAKLASARPDVITWYEVPVAEADLEGVPVDGIYDLEKFETRDKYAAFLRGNNGLMRIVSAGNRDHTEGEISRVMVVKDSFANSLVPYLTYHYDEIYVVDLRHLAPKMKDLLTEIQPDELLVIYNFMNFASDTSVAKLRY